MTFAKKLNMTPNNPDYPTCELTYGRLCILGSNLVPEEVTSLLGIQPTRTQLAGESRPSRNKAIIYELSGWFLSTEGVLASRDSRDHVDWILQKLESKDKGISEIHRRGWNAYLFFYWSSYSGHGGPTLSPTQMGRLSELSLEISFDCYFPDYNEECEQGADGDAEEAV